MRSWSALVVEDEHFARLELVELLREHPGIRVAAEASTLEDARAALRLGGIDVVFLDIALGAESGFDLLPSLDHGCQVVFVTAHDAHAIRAFEVNAVDYLLKPVSPQRLAEAIARLGESPRTARTSLHLPYDGHLFIDSGPLCGFVAVRDIRCILAEGDYSRVVLGPSRSALALRPLADWEDRLPPERFVRIHRSSIVNRDHVARMEPRVGGGFRVFIRELRDPLDVSRRYAKRLRAT